MERKRVLEWRQDGRLGAVARGPRLKHAEMGRLPLISSGNRMTPELTFYWTSLGYITVRLQADDILLDPILKGGVWINFT